MQIVQTHLRRLEVIAQELELEALSPRNIVRKDDAHDVTQVCTRLHKAADGIDVKLIIGYASSIRGRAQTDRLYIAHKQYQELLLEAAEIIDSLCRDNESTAHRQSVSKLLHNF